MKVLIVFVKFQCDSLQKHVSIVNNDLIEQERKFRTSQHDLALADEDLVSVKFTRWIK